MRRGSGTLRGHFLCHRRVQERERGSSSSQQDQKKLPGRAGCQEFGNAAFPPSLPGIPGKSGGDREMFSPSPKVPRPADGDRWNEGRQRESGKINSSRKNIEFKMLLEENSAGGLCWKLCETPRHKKRFLFREANDLIKMYVHDNALAGRESRSYLLQLRHFPCPCPGKG